MSSITSLGEMGSSRTARPWAPVSTALEVLLIYAGILYYIWRWQFTSPWLWMILWAAILFSHLAHRDTLRTLGLGASELRASAQIVLPLALAAYLPLLVVGFLRHSLIPGVPGWQVAGSLVSYAAWCAFQQYLTQSYFHNRLMSIIPNRHLTALLVGLLFGSAHIPNPILMAATTFAGFVFAEIFARHRNIWPLALAQAVGGILLAAISPDTLIHHMRVGPGYFFYQLR